MAKKQSTKSDDRAKWIGFFNWRITEAEKKEVRKHALKDADVTDVLVQLSQRGYKTTVGWDGNSDCYMVAVTGALVSCANAGYTMSVRHVDLLTALSAAFWKVAVAHDWGEWPDENAASEALAW